VDQATDARNNRRRRGASKEIEARCVEVKADHDGQPGRSTASANATNGYIALA
jgi:hypothetical protein